MAIKDSDGTTSYEIKKIWDLDGTTYHVINKVYDNNGTTDSLIFSSEEAMLNGSTGSGNWTVTVSGKATLTKTSAGIVQKATDNGASSASEGTAKSTAVNLTGYTKITTVASHSGSKIMSLKLQVLNSGGTVVASQTIFDVEDNTDAKSYTKNLSISLSGNHTLKYLLTMSAYYGTDSTITIESCTIT